MRIDQDAWDDWLGSPVTEALLAYCRVKAEEQKARWLQVSWDGGKADPLMLAKLQERSSVFEEISKITREEVET